MSPRKNYEELKNLALRLGITCFGTGKIDDLHFRFEGLSPSEVKGLNYGISMGMKVSDAVLNGIEDHPTRLYLHHYKTLNYFLDRTALAVSSFIESKGFRALPVPASQILDWKNMTGHLSHKMMAKRAGLGYIGRNNLLIHLKFSARLRLVSILTDIPLKTDDEIKGNCGNCFRCVEMCPAKALKETPNEYDRIKCEETLRFFSRKYNIGHLICGICVKACEGKRA